VVEKPIKQKTTIQEIVEKSDKEGNLVESRNI